MKRTILVVGAGQGLGNGVAAKFGKNGFCVILMARNGEHLKDYAKEFANNGIEVHTKIADVTNFSTFTEAFHEVENAYGLPDVLFYNVGITVADAEVTLTPQTLMDRYAADVVGAYNCIQLIDTKEFAAKEGAILITGGGLALEPYAGYLPLSMDKAALRAMVQALAPVLKEKGIYLGTVQIAGVIGSSDFFSPNAIADEFWKLYVEKDAWEIVYKAQ